MKNTIFIIATCVLGVSFSGCVNMNQNLRADLDILKAKVARLEAESGQTESGAELRNVVVGEQKRGEYLQLQILEMASRLDSLENQKQKENQLKVVAVPKSKPKASSSSEGKFISAKLSSPPSVKEVQLALRNAGYYDSAIDGIAGRGSRSAVKQFQKNNGLKADGIVGRQTWKKLKSYL